MNREELVRKVCAMLEDYQDVADNLKLIKTPEDLSAFLKSLSTGRTFTEVQSKRFLNFLKEKGVFKMHFSISGMEKTWREWVREQGIKEGHFLFEN